MDHVVAEARRHGIRLLFSLVNNLEAYGGKTQYVKWAWDEGVGLSSSNDSFFYDPSIRQYFKDYVKVLTLSVQLLFTLRSSRLVLKLRNSQKELVYAGLANYQRLPVLEAQARNFYDVYLEPHFGLETWSSKLEICLLDPVDV